MLYDANTYHRPALAVNSVLTTAVLGILADACWSSCAGC